MAEKIFTVDRFLGLNESVDGMTELKMGEASKIENFTITDDYNLKNRPGIRKFGDLTGEKVLRAWTFLHNDYKYLAVVQSIREIGYDFQKLTIFKDETIVFSRTERAFYNVFPYDGKISILYWGYEDPEYGDTGTPYDVKIMYFVPQKDGSIPFAYLEVPHHPRIITNASPTGGGTNLEKMNILSRHFREHFVADGASKKFVLSPYASEVFSIEVDGDYNSIPDNLGSYDIASHTFTFISEPTKDVNVEFYCTTDDTAFLKSRNQLLSMPYSEMFNGATDSRVFFYGDGSNLCYYTGIPSEGSGIYVPAMNELVVDYSNSPITAMVRHYSRLLVFKPDGVDAITYEPITLADDTVTAGFYLHPVHREFGNDAPGQVKLINNSPRSFTKRGIYEWRVSSSAYRDERYAKKISQKVSKTILTADPAKLIALDDEVNKTYYVFLNDDAGTVLVNRYDLEVWSIFKSALTAGVSYAFLFDGKTVFIRDDGVYCFDETRTFDAPAEDGGEIVPIPCVWESGYMSFGADYKRKYSSNLWVSMLPEANSRMEITVQTDRRDEYLEKVTGLPLLDFSNVDFSYFSFLRSLAPKIKRIKIKVKKFVYYKLIFRVTQAGAKATVLGYDQQVRYSSNVK